MACNNPLASVLASGRVSFFKFSSNTSTVTGRKAMKTSMHHVAISNMYDRELQQLCSLSNIADLVDMIFQQRLSAWGSVEECHNLKYQSVL